MPMKHGLGFTSISSDTAIAPPSASNAELKQVAFSQGVQLNPNIVERQNGVDATECDPETVIWAKSRNTGSKATFAIFSLYEPNNRNNNLIF
jgi:hypothetical protein